MIFNIFGSMWRWVQINIFRVEGVINEASDKLTEDPHVIDQIFRKAISGDSKSIQMMKDAVASLDARRIDLETDLKNMREELQEMIEALDGAKSVGEERAKELQAAGKSMDEILADPEFIEAQEFYEDQKSTIVEREARITEREDRIGEINNVLEEKELQLKELHRRLEKLKLERHERSADAVFDRQMADVADAIAGINTEGHRKDLAAARQASNRLKASAKLSNKLAGMDGRSQREKFRQKAQKKKAASEFASLVGVAKNLEDTAKADTAQGETEKPATLDAD
jgi:DNA repair exonuclease SbcCD ATPase subunit